ncbi:Thioredoxin O1 mitochondrial [Bienertia sinuspersici]
MKILESTSNVVLVQSDDQLKDSLKMAEDESAQAIFYFTAAWCGPCDINVGATRDANGGGCFVAWHRQFLWPDMKKLSEHLPNVKFYKIDIDEGVVDMVLKCSFGRNRGIGCNNTVGAGPTISKLSIFSVPTLHFFKNGKKAAEVIGADVKKIKDVSSSLYKVRIFFLLHLSCVVILVFAMACFGAQMIWFCLVIETSQNPW